MKRPFLLFKRGQLWYYRLAGEKTFHTTGQTARGKAEAFVVELLRNTEGHGRQQHLSFRRYTEPFSPAYHSPFERHCSQATTENSGKYSLQVGKKRIILNSL